MAEMAASGLPDFWLYKVKQIKSFRSPIQGKVTQLTFLCRKKRFTQTSFFLIEIQKLFTAR